jgi:SAM-dependent methyltransferase
MRKTKKRPSRRAARRPGAAPKGMRRVAALLKECGRGQHLGGNEVIDESAVDQRISPAERMLGASGREHYFRVGQSALECIQKALDIASISPHRIKRILDLPCGHGRVLRYLKAAFPEAEITACDLLRDGVDYCSSMFGATALYSCDDPEDIPLHPGSFDLIWVGSLLTHLDAPLWPRFLAVLRNALSPGGLLVFTTHGRHSYQLLLGSTEYGLSNRQTTLLAYRYEGSGFAYTKYLGSESDYGHSLSHPAWVIHQLTALGGLRLVNFSEKAWDQQQDVFASIREPACEGDIRRTPAVRYLRHLALERMNPRLRSTLENIWIRWF